MVRSRAVFGARLTIEIRARALCPAAKRSGPAHEMAGNSRAIARPKVGTSEAESSGAPATGQGRAAGAPSGGFGGSGRGPHGGHSPSQPPPGVPLSVAVPLPYAAEASD